MDFVIRSGTETGTKASFNEWTTVRSISVKLECGKILNAKLVYSINKTRLKRKRPFEAHRLPLKHKLCLGPQTAAGEPLQKRTLI